jgi:NADPH:quinone reductase-like Zn-dependent oxidoreductase
MRAAVISEPGGPDVLKIMEVDDPTPGPEDILIYVHPPINRFLESKEVD